MPISSSRNPVSYQQHHNNSIQLTEERKGKLNLDDQRYFEQLFKNGGGDEFDKHQYSKNYPRKTKQERFQEKLRLQRLHVDSSVAPTPRYTMPFHFVRFEQKPEIHTSTSFRQENNQNRPRLSSAHSDTEFEYVDREPHIFSVAKEDVSKSQIDPVIEEKYTRVIKTPPRKSSTINSREHLYIQDLDLSRNRYGTCCMCYKWWHIFLWGIIGGLGLAALITGIVYAKL